MWIGQQIALVALLLFAAVWPFWAFRWSRPDRSAWRGTAWISGLFLGVLIPLACFTAALTFRGREIDYQGLKDQRPIQQVGDRYVRSQSCQACHPNQHASWHDSYHRRMTQVATPETVVGDFDNRILEFDGVQYWLHRSGDEYFVTVAQWNNFRGKVVLTTGSHHMQLYWYATKRGRLVGLLPFVYLVPEKRWMPRHMAFLMPSDRHREIPVGRWNQTCLRCHTTHPRSKSQDIANVQTEVAEFGIACEACHGPGEEHVRANSNPLARFRRRLDGVADDTIVNPANLDHVRASQICGLCHSVSSATGLEDAADFFERGYRYRPGEDLTKSRHLVQLTTAADDPMTEELLQHNPDMMHDTFWADGMVRVTGREYTGLIQSPCYQRGQLSCMSCHEMHRDKDDPRAPRIWADDQLRSGMRGNQACLSCHEQFREQQDLVAHTHHDAQSAGSQCMNCHMPHTTYGLQKAIRSHQISSPSVLESLSPEPGEGLKALQVREQTPDGETEHEIIVEPRTRSGRPNACNQCHLDRTLAWTANHMQQWYGQELPEFPEEHRTTAAGVVNILKGDAGLRALAAWNLGWTAAQETAGVDWMPPYLSVLLDDPYDAVRYISFRTLQKLPGYEEISFDSLATPQSRRAAQERVMQIWQARQKTSKRTVERRADVLIDESGDLRHDLVDSLLKKRDNRRISLAE